MSLFCHSSKMKVDHRLWFKAKIQSIIEKTCEAEVEGSADLYLSLWNRRKVRRQEAGLLRGMFTHGYYYSKIQRHVILRHFLVVDFYVVLEFQHPFSPTTSELCSIMQAYALVGFPGCVGSIDCTHIRWWNCPSKHRNSCHGKEGYPTLGFQVIVDNTKRILHVSKGYFGSLNDQNICDIDPIIYNDNGGIVNLARDRRFLYNDVKFDLYDSDGNVDRIVGAYYISDGGYPPISVFISPTNRRFDKAAVYWSEFLESV